MPRGSEELTRARREEIINACAALYETMRFRDITLQEIGRRTTFTRTSIYNYFHTKEEIFLALLQREYEAWVADLDALTERRRAVRPEEVPGELARTLERRGCMLKLLAMNLYDLEDNSRMENLVAFKGAYARSMEAVSRCLRTYFPRMTEEDCQELLYALFPFLFGIHPYTAVTEKQREAMDLARVPYVRYSAYEITRSLLEKLLRGFLPEGTPEAAGGSAPRPRHGEAERHGES